MKLRLLLLTCFLMLVAGCSTQWAVLEPVSVLQQRLALWDGFSSERLERQIGQPYEKAEDDSGNNVLIYYKERLSPDNKLWHCKVSFTLNNDKNITSTRLISRTENVWGSYMPCVHIIQNPA